MKRLIVAEKPSVGMNIADAIGKFRQNDGFMENGEYIVTWCIGHLVGLADTGAYDDKYLRWEISDLPIIPEGWKYAVNEGKKRQYKTVSGLMNRDDIEEIINACDAGREGELIFSHVYDMSGSSKPVKRLWLSSMEEKSMRQGMDNLRNGEEYVSLLHSAECRERADWLVGINATRLYSVMYHRKLNIGRVFSPALSMIVERESDLQSFLPEPFYMVEIKCSGMTVHSGRLKNKDEADKILSDCQGKNVTITEVITKEKRENPPPLYDLTSLQRDANKLFGYSAQLTLDYAQALYEKKLVTYPRTDSRYLTDDMEEKVSDLVSRSADICGLPVPYDCDTSAVCDSRKVSDHHAIVITPSSSLCGLSEGEKTILKLIALRMIISTGEPYRYIEKSVTADCGGHIFTAKGKSIIYEGWRQYDKNENNAEDRITDIAEKDSLPIIASSVKKGMTSPPKRYTEAALLSAMERAGSQDMPENAVRKGIGTPATRAGIIEKLISCGFVERRKSGKNIELVPTQKGSMLYAVMPEDLRSANLTAEWENKLKQVENGEITPEKFMYDIEDFTRNLVENRHLIDNSEKMFPSGRPEICRCPRCGAAVSETEKGFFCEKYSCRFGIWKDNKYLAHKKIRVDSDMVKELIENGKVFIKGMYSQKTGKNFDAYLTFSDDGNMITFGTEFPEKETDKKGAGI